MNKKKELHSQNFNTALSGIMCAVSFVLVFLAGMTPAGGLSLLAIASFFIGIIVLESGIGYATLAALIAGTLTILFVYNKLMAIPAITFFLLYPLIKALIERENFVVMPVSKNPLKWILKLLFFAMSLCGSYYLLDILFGIEYLSMLHERIGKYVSNVPNSVSISAIVFVMIAVFVIYDILFTMLGKIYIRKYSSRLRGMRK